MYILYAAHTEHKVYIEPFSVYDLQYVAKSKLPSPPIQLEAKSC